MVTTNLENREKSWKDIKKPRILNFAHNSFKCFKNTSKKKLLIFLNIISSIPNQVR